MICASCGSPLATDAPVQGPCAACNGAPLVDGRFRLDRRVASGGSGTIYRGRDLRDGEVVAIKEAPLRAGDDDKVQDLVRREAEVLRQLDHPQIPRWRGQAISGRGRSRALFLVQDFVEGTSLAEELLRHRYTEAEVLAVMAELLPVLGYLHGLHPPVIHRDLKPGNLIRRADGRLFLVDFGAVRDALARADVGGSTVAGTFGYMAPEQFRGHAEPGTDLYALGCTAVALLSRQDPAALHDRAGRFGWREAVRVSPGTTALLAELLDPDPDRRAQDAEAVLARVQRLLASGGAEEPESSPHRRAARTGEAQGGRTSASAPGTALRDAQPTPRGMPEPEPFEAPVVAGGAGGTQLPAGANWTAYPRYQDAWKVAALAVALLLLGGAGAQYYVLTAPPAPPIPAAPSAPEPSPVRLTDVPATAPVPASSVSCKDLPGDLREVEDQALPYFKQPDEARVVDPPAPPRYPQGAPSGDYRCEARLSIDSEGRPARARISTSGCPSGFAVSVCTALPGFRFEAPAHAKGEPFETTLVVRFRRGDFPPGGFQPSDPGE